MYGFVINEIYVDGYEKWLISERVMDYELGCISNSD